MWIICYGLSILLCIKNGKYRFLMMPFTPLFAVHAVELISLTWIPLGEPKPRFYSHFFFWLDFSHIHFLWPTSPESSCFLLHRPGNRDPSKFRLASISKKKTNFSFILTNGFAFAFDKCTQIHRNVRTFSWTRKCLRQVVPWRWSRCYTNSMNYNRNSSNKLEFLEIWWNDHENTLVEKYTQFRWI